MDVLALALALTSTAADQLAGVHLAVLGGLLLILYRCVVALIDYLGDAHFGKKTGCESAQHRLAYKWPLAIDVVKRAFEAHHGNKLLAFFTDCFAMYGSTIELIVLGTRGYVTMDPENIQTILSDRFEGIDSRLNHACMILDLPADRRAADFHIGPRGWGMLAMIGEGITELVHPVHVVQRVEDQRGM